jgi:hypothetical protein
MKYILFTLMFAVSGFAGADSLSESSDQLCEKIKACGMEQMLAEEDLPPEMMEMMKPMYADLCKTIISPYIVKTEDAGLQSMAIACLDTINDMNCTDLMDGAGEEADACIEFQEAANEAGLLDKEIN